MRHSFDHDKPRSESALDMSCSEPRICMLLESLKPDQVNYKSRLSQRTSMHARHSLIGNPWSSQACSNLLGFQTLSIAHCACLVSPC